MSTAVINVKVDHQVKTRAKRAAARLGLNLSSVINGYLRELIRTETFSVSTRAEEPTEELLASLRQSERERKLGKNYAFDNPEEALAFLDTVIAKKR